MLQPSPLSPSFTHYLPCSRGRTALKYAIDKNEADVAAYLDNKKADDVIAYLRSIGAPE